VEFGDDRFNRLGKEKLRNVDQSKYTPVVKCSESHAAGSRKTSIIQLLLFHALFHRSTHYE